jgi:hypothetical protein
MYVSFFYKFILDTFLSFLRKLRPKLIHKNWLQGHVNPALTTNFALANGQANPQIGGGLNLGNFNLGNPNQFFG